MFYRTYFVLLLLLAVFIYYKLSTYNSVDTIIIARQDTLQTKPGPDPRPSEWAWIQRTFPYWKSDRTAYYDALKTAQKMKTLRKRVDKNNKNWEFVGPFNIGGRVVDIEFDPLHPHIVYAAAATGGVFKSTDSGDTWFPIFDDQAVMPIGDIGIDPLHPDTIYVGTGEPNGGHNNLAGGGVFKSMDGGETWQFIGLENTVSTGRILIDPSNTQRVFIASVGSYFGTNPERGVYRSDNGGVSWSQVLSITDSTGAIDIVMNPENPSILFAAMWERVRRPNSSRLSGPTSGIYRTFDSGHTWEHIGASNGLPDPKTTDVGRIGLAISHSQSNIIYALYNDGRDYIGLYKTADNGNTWSDADPDKEIDAGTRGFSWFFGQVRVHPTNPDIVFVMDVGFMKSTDGGDNWSLTLIPESQEFHVDHHALAFNPHDPDYMIDGNDGGINITTDGGTNWTKAANLPVTQFYEITIDHTNPERLYGGTQDNGTLRTPTGALNDWERIFGGDGLYVLVDPNNPDVIYAETQFGHLGKSVNGGQNFSIVLNGIQSSEPTNWSTPVVMDPNDSKVLYYGTNRINRTVDGALNWTAISGDLTNGYINDINLGTVTAIAIAPTNSNIIYVGTDDGNVWITDDYGDNWTKVSGSLPYRWVTRIAVDPQDEGIAYIAFSGLKWKEAQPHVFRTADFGLTWENISNNLPDAPVNAFVVDPYQPQILYLGSDVGAYVSFNTGQNWEVLGNGLPLVSVYDLKIHPIEYFLIAGTHGRSMYKLDLVNFHGRRPPILTNFILGQNYPNPFNTSTTITYKIQENDNQVTLQVYDIVGRKLRTLVNENLKKNTYQVEWDGKNDFGKPAASGIYFYRLTISSGQRRAIITKKMVLLK